MKLFEELCGPVIGSRWGSKLAGKDVVAGGCVAKVAKDGAERF